MPSNYAPGTPFDKFGSPKYSYPPAKVALSAQNHETAVTSSILLLTHDTTEIAVTAVTGTVAGKWLSQSVVDSSVAGTSVITAINTSNFDFTVPVSTTRHFVVPIATYNQAQQSVQGVNRLLGLYPAVAFKTIVGIGSVLTVQY